MKKVLYIIVFFFFFLRLDVYANEDVVTVISGLPKSYEVTFDNIRVISGTAKEGTKVIIKQYIYMSDGSKSLQKVTIYHIGKTESFTDILRLLVGLNEIEVTGELEEMQEIEIYQINKKDEKIIERLESVSDIFNVQKK